MAGTVNAGSIIYEVDMDTARLLSARREVDAALNGMSGSMGRLESSVNRTERSVDSMQRTLTGLSAIARGVMAAISIQQVTAYGNEWVTVNNKLANSIRANEDLAQVTQRVFDISQNTMSSLTATATLYGRLERATRSAGTSTKDLVTLTETINKGLAVSGATSEEASSTMTQLSQALASGVLRGEEFNSISENGSRLAVALADSLGVTIGQLRGMAAQGKLTTDVVVNGLLKQSNAIAKEFGNTALTMGQAFTVATNNITKFVGESSTVQTSINGFNSVVITLSENLEIISSAVSVVATVFGSRFVGALTLATAAKYKSVVASRQQAVSENNAAQAALSSAAASVRKTLADKEAAISSMNLAQAEYNVARGSAAEAIALDNLVAKKSLARAASLSLAEAEMAQAAATARASAAASAASFGTATLRSALSLIGGPAGAAMLAGAAIFYFYEKSQRAKQEAIDFADKLDGVIAKMRKMNDIQLSGTIADLNTSLRAQQEQLSELSAAHQENINGLYNAQQAMKNSTAGSWSYQAASKAVSEWQDKVAQSARDTDVAETKLSRTKSALGMAQAQLSGQLKEGLDLLAKDAENAGVAAGMMSHLGKMIDVASSAKEKFNASSLNVGRSDKGDKYLEKIKEENDLLAITDKRERAISEARQKAINDGVGLNSNQLRQIEEAAAKNYDLKESEKERDKATRSATSAEKKAETQAAKNTRVLEEYRQKAELSSGSTSELSREQAILAAKNKLINPTSEQVATVERDAAAAWDKAAALKAQSSVPELKENADYAKQKQQLELLKSAKDSQGDLLISQQQYNQQSEQLEQDHQTKLAEIRANQAVTPQQDAAAKVDPVQQLANENARKLALIQQFEANKTLTHDQAEALRNATDTQYEQQRIAAQWTIYRNQSVANELLASSIESFSSGASSAITGLINGTQSLSESFANLGTSILNGVVSSLVQMGTQWVMSTLMGQAAQESAIAANQATSIAALAASTSAGIASASALLTAWSPAAMAASVASYGGAATAGLAGYTTAMTAAQTMSIAGARKNGGPVSADSMYRVGEGGKPEIFKASNGSQYMIPGDNGSVISNKDLGSSASGGTAIQQTVQFNIQTTGGIDDATMQKMSTMMKQVSLSTIKDQQRPSGLLSKTR